MAIIPESQYPGKITPASADYPYGQARNITLPGDGTGTPWEAALVNDLFGSQQALLEAADITPSGDPETAVVSQYLEAQRKYLAGNTRTFFDKGIKDASAINADDFSFIKFNYYTTPGDGGRATFRVVPGGTGTADGFLFHDTLDGKQLQLMNPERASFKLAGVVADGTVDDSDQFEAWINGTRKPNQASGTIRLTRPITCSTPIKWVTAGPSLTKIKPDLGADGGKVIAFETDDVHVEGVGIDGTGLSYTLTANQYCLFSGDGVTKFYNHTFKNNEVQNVSASDGNTGASNLLVTHGLYVDNVDNVTIKHNEFKSLSGAGIFKRNINGLSERNNLVEDCVWYPIHFEGGVIDFECAHNRVISNIANGVFYGGGVNLMSQHMPLETRNARGSVHHNHFEGTFSYGAVIRALSCEDIDIHDNTGENLTIGAVSLSPTLTAIRVDTRGTSTAAQNGPCKNIHIFRNKFKSGTTGANEHLGLYVSNAWQSARDPIVGLRVHDNEFISPSATEYWESPMIFHGLEGGMEDLWILNNTGVGFAQSGPIVDGALGLVAGSAQGAISGVHIGGNTLRDLGTPAASYQLGVGIGAYVDRVFNDAPNTVDNYWFGVRTFTNAGPTLDKIDDQEFLNTGSLDTLFGVTPSRFGTFLEGSKTYDPPSIATGSQATTDVTVSGASTEDFVRAAFDLDLQGVTISAEVRAPNTVRVVFQNLTGGAIDLASGTLKVRVYR